LQHSRKRAGVLESTDLNELVEEYCNLGYSAFKVKIKGFPCTFQNQFDNNIGRVLVVREDIGDILLNLLNNAFYSMNEKLRIKVNEYAPVLIMSTKRVGHKVKVILRDNGMGISPGILDRIFQPFFTTKPTGEATGLGLSLSYDMIKSHDGDLQVESKEGEYAEFVIELKC